MSEFLKAHEELWTEARALVDLSLPRNEADLNEENVAIVRHLLAVALKVVAVQGDVSDLIHPFPRRVEVSR